MAKEIKTNVMRILDREKIAYVPHFYEADPKLTGAEIAKILNEDPASVFKTLVAKGKSGAFFAFLVPVAKELDLKAAALAAKEKSIEMLPLKQLLPTTGYVHGGCSPIGMKKRMAHFIDSSCQAFQRISFSGGKVGCQVTVGLADALKGAELTPAPIAKDPDEY